MFQFHRTFSTSFLEGNTVLLFNAFFLPNFPVYYFLENIMLSFVNKTLIEQKHEIDEKFW